MNKGSEASGGGYYCQWVESRMGDQQSNVKLRCAYSLVELLVLLLFLLQEREREMRAREMRDVRPLR